MEVFNLSDKMTYSEKHLTKKIIYRDKDVLAFILNFKPGQALPVHNHPGMVTILQVLTGSGEFKADGKTVRIAPGQLLICQEKEIVSLINDGNEELSLYVTLTPGPTDDAFAEEF